MCVGHGAAVAAEEEEEEGTCVRRKENVWHVRVHKKHGFQLEVS